MGIVFISLAISLYTVFIGFLCMKNLEMNLYKWAIIIFMMIYGIFFGIVMFENYQRKLTIETQVIIDQISYQDLFIYFVCINLFYIFFTLGYRLKLFFKIKNRDIYDEKNFYNKVFGLLVCIFIIAVISYGLYARAYGGFFDLYEYTIAIRNGISTINNPFSFLQKFGSLSQISCYGFLAMYDEKKINLKFRYKSLCMFILSFIFSIYYLLSLGGRGSVMFFLLTLVMYYIFKYTNNLKVIILKYWGYFIYIFVAFLCVDIFWHRSDQMSGILEYIGKGWSILVVAFKMSLGDIQYRHFLDLIVFPLYLLPSSIWNSKLNIITANEYMTYLIQGGYKGDIIGGKLITGEANTGFIAYSYMQYSLVGIIVMAFILGIFLKYLDINISNIKYNSLQKMIYSVCLIDIVFSIIVAGDISNFIIGIFNIISFIIFYKIYMKIELKKI